MLKRNCCVYNLKGNMQKAVLFFIFCVLLCEVSPKVPIRKEDLLNKKAALSKQLSPNVPKWDDLASKFHTKDKQNKSKTLMNLLKVVSAKEIDVPNADTIKNDTIINSNANINGTNHNFKNNETVQNNTYQNNKFINNPFRIIKLNTQANATIAKTPKKYAANETIGAKLAFFLLKNAVNSTKEKPNTPEIIAPTMIPIFKPMPSSTRNTIPQPLANELIRKDNFVPKELNPQQLKNLDKIELNPNVFDPLKNKAVLNPLLASEAVPKDVLPKDVNYIESKEPEHGLKPVIHSQIRTASETATSTQPSDITLNYVDTQSTHRLPNDIHLTENIVSPVQNLISNIANNQPAQDTGTIPVQGSNPTKNRAFTNQMNHGNVQSHFDQPTQNSGPQYELKISPPLPRNENENTNTIIIRNGNLPIGLNSQFIQEQLNNFEKTQSTSSQDGVLINHNDFAVNQNDLNIHHGFGVDKNDFIVNQKNFAIDPNNLQANKNDLYQNLINFAHQHSLPVNQNDFKVNKNELTNNAINTNTINAGVKSNPELNQKVVPGQANVNSRLKTTGFNLPCLKASDVLEDFVTTPSCCQRNKPYLNSRTENPVQKMQCEKPILVDGDNNEDVAIVFKPKNISLLKFYGDLLKKITLTVLVPYHISKLTSQ